MVPGMVAIDRVGGHSFDCEDERYLAMFYGLGDPNGQAMLQAAYQNNPDRDPGPIFAFSEWLTANGYVLYGAMTHKHAEDYRVQQLRIPEAI